MKGKNFINEWLTFLILLLSIAASHGIPKQQTKGNENCGFSEYEAQCVLDILEEHIEATAVINHCHIPLDITFRVVYRYGNNSDQRWQYTFVTTNQNERVLIPGLKLPPAPQADVYLYVRVPHPLFDLHNSSVAAVEASFVAIISKSEWEEVEFLNEAVTITDTSDCFTSHHSHDPLLWILGGAFIGLLFVGAVTTGVLWWYRKHKIALDELALVASLETGLPGSQPYQVETGAPRQNNNTILVKENSKDENSTSQQAEKQTSSEQPPKKTPPAFKFGRLKEESPEDVKEKIARKLGKAVVIGNPVLVNKTSALHDGFNKMAATSFPDQERRKNITDTAGDAFENTHTIRLGEGSNKEVMETSMSYNPTSNHDENRDNRRKRSKAVVPDLDRHSKVPQDLRAQEAMIGVTEGIGSESDVTRLTRPIFGHETSHSEKRTS